MCASPAARVLPSLLHGAMRSTRTALTTESHSIVWTHRPVLTHSSAHRHCGCFHRLATAKKAATHSRASSRVDLCVHFSHIFLGVELLGHVVALCLTFGAVCSLLMVHLPAAQNPVQCCREECDSGGDCLVHVLPSLLTGWGPRAHDRTHFLGWALEGATQTRWKQMQRTSCP